MTGKPFSHVGLATKFPYRKDKSIDDLTLNHMMFFEDTQHFPMSLALLSVMTSKMFRPNHY